MIYINGLGYVDDSYAIKATETQKTTSSAFSDILANETNSKKTDSSVYTLDEIFTEAASKYNVSKDLLTAVAYNESRFQSDVVSSSGATGIMQLMPATARAMGVTDSTDVYQNIMGGAKLLGQLSSLYNGDTKLTLAAYNAGTGNVEKYGGIPPFEETQNYVTKVINTMNNKVTIPDEAVTTTTSSANTTSTASNTSASNSVKEDSFYSSSNLDSKLSYEEYELLMKYYTQMLDIISDIGGNEDDSEEEEEDNSLVDLYNLSVSQTQDTDYTSNSTFSSSAVASIYKSIADMTEL